MCPGDVSFLSFVCFSYVHAYVDMLYSVSKGLSSPVEQQLTYRVMSLEGSRTPDTAVFNYMTAHFDVNTDGWAANGSSEQCRFGNTASRCWLG